MECGAKTEVYSRICGYMRPITYWNAGKKQEFEERVPYKIPAPVIPKPPEITKSF
jgi:ribonucleoside-triphosphate reductase